MKVKMTPERASELLANNKGNRAISNGALTRYMRDMKAGRWVYNGAPVIIADTGRLMDGQHRLEAIRRSGVTCEVELLEGLPESVMGTIDDGLKRRAGHVLQMQGVVQAVNVASSARLAINYLTGVAAKSGISTTEIVEFVTEHARIMDGVHTARHAHDLVPSGPMGATLFLAQTTPGFEKRAMSFVEPLAKGTGLEEGDPRLALRNTIINARLRTPNGRAPDQLWVYCLIINCWNAWAIGRPLQHARAQAREGKLTPADIIGAPKFGAGVDALGTLKLTAKAARAMAANGDGAEAAA